MHSSARIEEYSSKSHFRIEFKHNRVETPVFIAGTFTDPAWKEIKMKTQSLRNSDTFKSEVKLDISKNEQHQYKFRFGNEDWVLNEDEPSELDDHGNRNNIILTKDSLENWVEKASSGKGGELWEERRLTNNTFEERKKFPEAFSIENSQNKQLDSTQISQALISANQAPGKELRGKHEGQDVNSISNGKNELPKPKSLTNIETNHLKSEISLEESLSSINDKISLESIEKYHPSFTLKNQHPTVGLEKIDAKRSGNESTEPNAIHDSQILNLKSYKEVIPQQINTSSFANTADEVADIAATIDLSSPSPPITDAEAGRVGLRRLSNTPIPMVSKVAAEVADVAATLDNDMSSRSSSRKIADEEKKANDLQPITPPEERVPPGSQLDNPFFPHSKEIYRNGEEQEDLEIRQLTPPDESVPRFSYEYPLLPDSKEPSRNSSIFEARLPQNDNVPGTNDKSGSLPEEHSRQLELLHEKVRDIQWCLPDDSTPSEEAVIQTEITSQKPEVFSPKFTIQPHAISLQAIVEEENDSSDTLPESSKTKSSNLPNLAIEIGKIENIDVGDTQSSKNDQQKSGEFESDHLNENSTKEIRSKAGREELAEIGTDSELNKQSRRENNNDQCNTNISAEIEGGISEDSRIGKSGSHNENIDKKGSNSSNETDTSNNHVTALSLDSSEPLIAFSRSRDGSNDDLQFDRERKGSNEPRLKTPVETKTFEEKPKNIPQQSLDNGNSISSGVACNETCELTLRKHNSQRNLESTSRSIPPKSSPLIGNKVPNRGFINVFLRVIFVDWIGGVMRTIFGSFKRST